MEMKERVGGACKGGDGAKSTNEGKEIWTNYDRVIV